MIQFRCRCSRSFEVPDEEAGTSFQCPQCGLLVDVPTLEELPGVAEDGTIALELEPEHVGYKAGQIHQSVPSRLQSDTTDRRLSAAEFLKIGVADDDLLELKGESTTGAPVRPKYDPTTGELIKPIDVVGTFKPQPMLAQSATLAYERLAGDRPTTIWMPVREMFALPNLIVCVVVTVMCYANMVLLALTFAMFLPGVFVIGLTLMSIAHFANIVDETGPTGTDEMPTPLRGGSLYDDMILPLMQVFGAYLIAYSPILLCNLFLGAMPWELNLGLTLLLFVLVPATLITMTTSGAANNLIPSRMFSVIGAAGTHYWVVTLVGFVATIGFALGLLFSLSSGAALAQRLFTGPAAGPRHTMFGIPGSVETLVAPLVMLAGVYLMHVFAWQLGLIFRFHHDRFDWVLQKHHKVERNDAISQLHAHRQAQLEAQAKTARQNFDLRAMGHVVKANPIDAALARPLPTADAVPTAQPIPTARPVPTVRPIATSRPIPTAMPVARPAQDVPVARPVK